MQNPPSLLEELRTQYEAARQSVPDHAEVEGFQAIDARGFPEQEKALDNLRDIIKPLNAFLKNEGCPIKHDFGIDKIDSKKGEDP